MSSPLSVCERESSRKSPCCTREIAWAVGSPCLFSDITARIDQKHKFTFVWMQVDFRTHHLSCWVCWCVAPLRLFWPQSVIQEKTQAENVYGAGTQLAVICTALTSVKLYWCMLAEKLALFLFLMEFFFFPFFTWNIWAIDWNYFILLFFSKSLRIYFPCSKCTVHKCREKPKYTDT